MTVQNSALLQATVRNAALFMAATQARNLTNLLTGPVPKGQKDVGRLQTDPGAPIVRITELETQAGKTVTVDLIHKISKKPTMGGQILAGRGDNMSFAHDSISINQGRHMLGDGGKMLQQTTGQDLPAIAKKLLKGYVLDLDEETTLYHLSGARGSDYSHKHIVPLETDPEFAEIMVNEVLPPTYSRHFYGGDATSIEMLDSTDTMSLAVIDNLSLFTQEMGSDIPYVQLNPEDTDGEDPFYVMFITPRQWYDLQQQATTKDYNQMQANALSRSKTYKHRVFDGSCLMRENILVKKLTRRVRFDVGHNVKVCKNDRAATTELKTVQVPVERAFVLGAQALGVAYGQTKTAKSHFNLYEEKTDHGDKQEFSVAWCNGKKALRFEDRDGFKHDHGRIIVDTAVSTR